MNNIKNILGLAAISKKVVSGPQVIDTIRNKEAKLVLVASDASDNTKKKIFDKSKFYQIECFEVFDSDFLSSAIKKNNRVAIAITDKNFAQMIKDKIKEG